jgi:hypothetical protein
LQYKIYNNRDSEVTLEKVDWPTLSKKVYCLIYVI